MYLGHKVIFFSFFTVPEIAVFSQIYNIIDLEVAVTNTYTMFYVVCLVQLIILLIVFMYILLFVIV